MSSVIAVDVSSGDAWFAFGAPATCANAGVVSHATVLMAVTVAAELQSLPIFLFLPNPTPSFGYTFWIDIVYGI
jgi:hypothetical protein